MLRISNFKKSYRNQLILKIEEFVIEPGIFWVKGANGSGKSTLLKALAGALPFEGNIELLPDANLKQHSVAYRKLVNFAEAEPVYPEFLTGKEMITLFSVAKNAEKGQEDYFLETMKMQEYIGAPVGTYSSGMLKKLSLVLAFMGRPKVILLDEPLITIDTESLKILYAWITDQHQREGTSFLLSSHQPLEGQFLPRVAEILVAHQTIQSI